MAVYEESTDEGEKEKSTRLPQITEGATLGVEAVKPEQHFTEPPARYTEASLIKFMEEKGIGRPSTYSTIITLIVSRGYVKRQGKTLHPTPLGEVTTKLICEKFPDVADYQFTAMMENNACFIYNNIDKLHCKCQIVENSSEEVVNRPHHNFGWLL